MHHHTVYHWFQLTTRLVGNGGNSCRFVLIPVGNGGQVEGQAVVVSMLNGSLQPFFEEDGILDKETVDMCTAKEAHVVVYTRIAELDVLVGLLRTPGRIKKIFRTCP